MTVQRRILVGFVAVVMILTAVLSVTGCQPTPEYCKTQLVTQAEQAKFIWTHTNVRWTNGAWYGRTAAGVAERMGYAKTSSSPIYKVKDCAT